jgi:predicted dehydrogenase
MKFKIDKHVWNCRGEGTMGITDLLGVESDAKVRYAVVGLGDIAQEDMMPGVEHTGNSEITAFVTSDQVKARELGETYGVEAIFSYEQFDAALESGTFDAIYLATPNWRHAEFIIPALRAGIHVLTEKPLEVSTEKCRQIIEEAKVSGARIMVAYRLHFEPATLDTIDKIRAGVLGEVHLLASTFTQMVDPANHRARNGELAGPVFDMGPYPVNAARYIFSDEPTEVVSAVGAKHPQSGFEQDFSDTVAVTLRFPGDKLAQFNLCYFGSPSNSLIAVGTKGVLELNPAYTFGRSLNQTIVVGENKEEHSFKNTDQFGGELKYFSERILMNIDPEPDVEEGYADVRVLEGILKALETGQAVKLEPFQRSQRIDTDRQKMTLSAVSTPELVHASNPSRGIDKKSKN